MRQIKKCWWCQSTNLSHFTDRIDGKPVSECHKCKLLLVTELPDDLSEFYTDEAYFNPSADTDTGYHENYNMLSPLYLYWQGSVINEVVGVTKAKDLLEVGCATGNALEAIHERNESLEVSGIDLAPFGIESTKAKGFQAEVSTINDYVAKKQCHDIVFSSETMEHVDDLRDFVESVEKVLNKDGVFAFYIPAVVKSTMKKMGKKYPSLTTSLEHVSYFTTEFMTTAMKEVFGNVALTQMSTADEDYILGFASTNAGHIQKLQGFLTAINKVNKTIKQPDTLYNLVVIDAKFALFDQAEQYLAALKRFDKKELSFVLADAILAGHKGELDRAKDQYQKYLQKDPAAKAVVYKLVYANEKALSELHTERIKELYEASNTTELKLRTVSEELDELKNSKLVGTTIRARKVIGGVINNTRNQKKNG